MPHIEDLYRIVKDLNERTNDNTRRLRDLEQSIKDVSDSINALETERLEHVKEANREKEVADSEINELFEKVGKIESGIAEVINQLKKFATKSELVGMKELLDIYNPLESRFVTKDQVEGMIERSKKKK